MSFLQKVKEGLGRAAEEASDFAQVARIRMEVGRLQDRKNALLLEIGAKVYDAYASGGTVAEVEAQCQEVARIEGDIKLKQAEIERIQRENPSAATPEGEPDPTGSAAPAEEPINGVVVDDETPV